MSDRKVKIESMVNYTVVLSEPYSRFERVFNRDTQSALVDFETMEQGLQINGFRKLFTNGILRVVNEKDKVDLGLAAASKDDEIEEAFAISTGEIIKLFKSKDYTKIKETINKCSVDTVRNMISTMIKFKIYDNQIIDLLQKKAPSSMEIYDLIKLANDAEKPEFEFDE